MYVGNISHLSQKRIIIIHLLLTNFLACDTFEAGYAGCIPLSEWRESLRAVDGEIGSDTVLPKLWLFLPQSQSNGL